MRLDAIGLRTWWLCGVAGWAVLIWLMTLSGMGERIAASAGAAGDAQALPNLPRADAPRVGAMDEYPDIAAHPLFSEDRLPHPFFLSGGQGQQIAALRLSGVLITPDLKMATLTTDQGKSLRLRLGADDPVQGWRLLSLEPRSATVEGPGGAQTLPLTVFAGTAPAGDSASGGNPATTAPAPDPEDRGRPHVQRPVETEAAPAPTEKQLDAIRQRIEARRRQIRERQNSADQPRPNP